MPSFYFKDYVTSPLALMKISAEWKKTEAMNREQMDTYVLSRLQEICRYAKIHIPYYRELFARIDFDPEKLDSFEYYRKIPVMEKETVREHFEELQSDERDKLHPVLLATSGSTGTALRFYVDRAVNQATFCLFYKAWSMAEDWHLGLCQACLGGYSEGIYQYQWKTQVLALSSFYLTEKTVETYYRLIRRYRPRFLRGYPSALYLFGKLLEEKGLRLRFHTIFTGAETLLPFQREFLEEFFGAKVYDHYSHWERQGTICECPDGKLHALNYYGYHEILDRDGEPTAPGQEGRLVCTSLYNHVMPLLRYDTRDLAAFAEDQSCTCGSNQPVVDHIFGRVEDAVVTPDGRTVGRLSLISTKHIRLGHIYQPDRSRIIVMVVPAEHYSYEMDEEPLMRDLRARLGNEIAIEIRKVTEQEIPRTKGGKVRFVISDVPREEKYGLN